MSEAKPEDRAVHVTGVGEHVSAIKMSQLLVELLSSHAPPQKVLFDLAAAETLACVLLAGAWQMHQAARTGIAPARGPAEVSTPQVLQSFRIIIDSTGFAVQLCVMTNEARELRFLLPLPALEHLGAEIRKASAAAKARQTPPKRPKPPKPHRH